MKTYLAFAVALWLHLAPIPAQAAEPGYLGLSLEVDADGFFNPTLKTLTVKKVAPNSPAARAGIEAGDRIVEIDGRAVAGSKANDLKPILQGDVGRSVRMAVRKATGATTTVAVVLGRKPG